MSNSIIKQENIVSQIHFIRGEKVILDVDLAILYGVEVKRLKEAVRRNNKRFPSDFMFQLTARRVSNLEVANCVLKLGWSKILSLCIYGTKCGNAFGNFEQ